MLKPAPQNNNKKIGTSISSIGQNLICLVLKPIPKSLSHIPKMKCTLDRFMSVHNITKHPGNVSQTT